MKKEKFLGEDERILIYNKSLSADIELNYSGIKETLGPDTFKKMPKNIKEKKIATIRMLPDIIKKAVVKEDNASNYHNTNSGINYAYLEVNVVINGKPNRVKIDIRKSRQKNKFWVHSIYEIEENQTLLGSSGLMPKLALKEMSDFREDNITRTDESQENNSEIKKSLKAENNVDTKQKQLDIINKTNPAPNTYNTWIRTIDDIKTLSETLEGPEWDYEEFNPDLSRTDILNAVESGKITVYSSYPIENGVFVSLSRMEAESYSGNGKIYKKTVDINDVAWIDPTQGQFAMVEIKKSLKSLDTEYLNATESGDAETAQRLVDEAANVVLLSKRFDSNKSDIRFSYKAENNSLEQKSKISYSKYADLSPLLFNHRAQPNPNSNINWVLKSQIFSVVENKLFH